jgi:hypothetical protein
MSQGGVPREEIDVRLTDEERNELHEAVEELIPIVPRAVVPPSFLRTEIMGIRYHI